MMVWEYISLAGGHHHRAFVSCLLVLGIVGFSGCVPKKVTIKASPEFNSSSIQTIALLPLKVLVAPQGPSSLPMESMGSPTEFHSQFRLPTPAMSADRAGGTLSEVSPVDAQTVTRLIYESLKNRPGLHVIPPGEIVRSLSMTQSALRALPVLEQVKTVSSRLQVDGILTGIVRVYRKRAGNKIAASGAVLDLMSIWPGQLMASCCVPVSIMKNKNL